MRFPIPPGLVAWAALSLAAGPLHAAPVFFIDGASHVIPGDAAFADGDWVILNASSSLSIAAPASVVGDGTQTNDFAFGGDALVSAAGTSVRLVGGDVVGGSASVILDPLVPEFGLSAFGGYAMDAGGILDMSGGIMRGGAAAATGGAGVDQTSVFSGTGLQLGATVASVRGGRIESGLASAAGASIENAATSGDALIAWGGSLLQLRDTTIVAGDARAMNALSLEGDAVANGGRALWLFDGAMVVIESGSVQGGDAIAQAGAENGAARATPGPALAIDLGSRTTIRGGTFSAGAGATSAASGELTQIAATPAIQFENMSTSHPTRLVVFGGQFRGNGTLRVPFDSTEPSFARIVILGGDLDSPTGIDLDLAHPTVTTEIYGLGIALDGVPLASGPVTAATGTLTGTLTMGGSFSWTFRRRNAAPLEVQVPEPVAGLLPGLALLAGLTTRRRAARR